MHMKNLTYNLTLR